MNSLRCGFVLCLAFAFQAQFVQADVFILQNNGRINGEVVADEELPKTQLRIKTTVGGELLIERNQIKQVLIQSADEETYEAQRGNYPDTLEAQWKLAEWCREKGLIKQRNVHLERVIHLDPNHQAARSALGYQNKDGRWLRREDIMKERGYVLYKGEWKLQQEIDLLEAKRETEQREREWYVKLVRLRAEFMHVSKAKSQAAWDTLRELNDPHAVPAILSELNKENNPRLLSAYLTALGRIGTTPALMRLVQLALSETQDQYQEFALDQLKGGKHPEVVSLILTELKSKDNQRVNRAGYVLGEIGDASAIPYLIEALVTRHKFQVSAGGNGSTSSTFSPNGGGGGLGVGGKPQIIEQELQNAKVLAALYKLIGQNQGFDYNMNAWRAWYDANKKQPVISGRRD